MSIGRDATETDLPGLLQLIKHDTHVLTVTVVLVKVMQHQAGNTAESKLLHGVLQLRIYASAQCVQTAVVECFELGGNKRPLFFRYRLQPLPDDLFRVAIGRRRIQRADPVRQRSIQNPERLRPIRLAGLIVDPVADAELYRTE